MALCANIWHYLGHRVGISRLLIACSSIGWPRDAGRLPLMIAGGSVARFPAGDSRGRDAARFLVLPTTPEASTTHNGVAVKYYSRVSGYMSVSE